MGQRQALENHGLEESRIDPVLESEPDCDVGPHWNQGPAVRLRVSINGGNEVSTRVAAISNCVSFFSSVKHACTGWNSASLVAFANIVTALKFLHCRRLDGRALGTS